MDKQFKELLKDFNKVGDVEEDVIAKYKGIVSNEIIELWREYGYGSFYNDFMKIINPDEFMEVYGLLVVNITEDIPIFVTGMGDIIIYARSTGSFIDYLSRYGIVEFIPNHLEGLADELEFEYTREEYLAYLPYEEAVSKYGKLEYNQCFGYTPLLSLGGNENVDSLEKVDLMTHLEIIAQLQEPYVWECLK